MDMKELLRQIASGAPSLDSIAKANSVSIDAVRARIDTMVGLGLLEDINDECTSSANPTTNPTTNPVIKSTSQLPMADVTLG